MSYLIILHWIGTEMLDNHAAPAVTERPANLEVAFRAVPAIAQGLSIRRGGGNVKERRNSISS